MIIELKKPVVVGSTSYDRITLREPTIGEVIKAYPKAEDDTDGATVAVTNFYIDLVSVVSGISVDALMQFKASDLNKCVDYLSKYDLFTPALPKPDEKFEDEHMIPLTETLSFGKIEVSELFISEPTVSQTQEVNKEYKTGFQISNGRKRNVKLIALISKVPLGVIERLPFSKYAEAEKVLLFFAG